jgi:propionyl-CoA carboxylase alpha chain
VVEVGYRFDARTGLVAEVGGSPIEAGIVDLWSDRVGIHIDDRLDWFETNRVGDVHHVDGPGGYVELVELPRLPLPARQEETGSLHAPMPGRVITVAVEEGDHVTGGQVLIVMEAMKMEHSLRAPHDGIVRSVMARPHDQVAARQILMVLDDPKSEGD